MIPIPNVIVDRLFNELKTIPVTLFVIVALIFSVWSVRVSVTALQKDHVSIAEFTTLQGQLVAFQAELVRFTHSLDRNHADGQLHNQEAEIFSITRHIHELQKRGQPIDEEVLRRLDQLEHEHEGTLREINELDNRR